jgi:hypothetical protein
MSGEHAPAEWFDLTEGNGSHTGSLKAKAKSSNAAEKVKHPHSR